MVIVPLVGSIAIVILLCSSSAVGPFSMGEVIGLPVWWLSSTPVFSLENSSVLIYSSQMPSLMCCAPNVCVTCSNTCIQATYSSSYAWHNVPFLPTLLMWQIYVNAAAWLCMNKLRYMLLRRL